MTILTAKEAANLLKISKQTVYKIMQFGELKAVRVNGQWRTWQECCEDYLLKSAEVRIEGDILTLDPQIACGTPSEVPRMHIFEALITMDLEGKFNPCLAESWETSADGKEWTFHLRKGVKFHNGTELKAADVKRTFDRLINKEYNSSRIMDFPSLQPVEVVDDYTVKLKTSVPKGNFLNLLAYGAGCIMSAKAIDTYKDRLSTNVVGTGPYVLKEFIPSESVTMEANPKYWGEKPKIEKLVFKLVKESFTRITTAATVKAGYVMDIPLQNKDTIASSGKAKIREDMSNRVAQIGFNLNKKPFNNVKVRQALNYAINKDLIISGVMGGAAIPTKSVVAPNVWGYIEADKYTYDPAKAKQLLAEAGYPNGFTSKLWTPEGRYFMDKETCLAVSEQLKAIGVNLEVEVVDWETYLKELKVAEADGNKVYAYLLGWECYPREAGYSINNVFSKANMAPKGWNTMFYSNDELEALNMSIQSEVDSAKRMEYIHQALNIISEDAVWIPLYVYKQVTAYDTRLNGVYVYPTQIPKFEKAYFKS